MEYMAAVSRAAAEAWRDRHDRLMATDPEYVRRWKLRCEEWERVFAEPKCEG